MSNGNTRTGNGRNGNGREANFLLAGIRRMGAVFVFLF